VERAAPACAAKEKNALHRWGARKRRAAKRAAKKTLAIDGEPKTTRRASVGVVENFTKKVQKKY